MLCHVVLFDGIQNFFCWNEDDIIVELTGWSTCCLFVLICLEYYFLDFLCLQISSCISASLFPFQNLILYRVLMVSKDAIFLLCIEDLIGKFMYCLRIMVQIGKRFVLGL